MGHPDVKVGVQGERLDTAYGTGTTPQRRLDVLSARIAEWRVPTKKPPRLGPLEQWVGKVHAHNKSWLATLSLSHQMHFLVDLLHAGGLLPSAQPCPPVSDGTGV